MEIPLIILLSAAVIAAAVFAVLYFREKKKCKTLNADVETFLQSGKTVPISTADDDFSLLRNNVSELSERLMLEKSNAEAETRKNIDFIADVSHQLKTPLAGLKLYCEMDAENGGSDYSEKELRLIEKMENLVKNLLKLEKLRSDAYEMEFSPCSMGKIINEVTAEYSHMFPEKRITLLGDAEIRCDSQWMSEAVGNIVKNAAEHTEQNGKIAITVERAEQSVSVTVEDDGGGVNDEQLQLIFNRFYRTRNASPDSTGIGMAITRAIVEKHHGTVTAENGKEGLKVIICLPVIDANVKI